MTHFYKKILTASILLASAISNTLFAADVTNVSSESFVQYGKENAYWAVSVSCDDGLSDRVVQRKTDSETWCPKDDDSLCSEDKLVATQNACSPAYQAEVIATAKKKALESRRRAKAAEAAAKEKENAERVIREAELALQNKISIDEQLVAIEQKRLELSQQELEIDRRIVEIDEILKTEED